MRAWLPKGIESHFYYRSMNWDKKTTFTCNGRLAHLIVRPSNMQIYFWQQLRTQQGFLGGRDGQAKWWEHPWPWNVGSSIIKSTISVPQAAGVFCAPWSGPKNVQCIWLGPASGQGDHQPPPGHLGCRQRYGVRGKSQGRGQRGEYEGWVCRKYHGKIVDPFEGLEEAS